MLARLGPNKLKAALRARNSSVPLGLWASSCSTQVTELLAHSGLDWLCVDMEHAPNELPDVLAHLQPGNYMEVIIDTKSIEETLPSAVEAEPSPSSPPRGQGDDASLMKLCCGG